MHRHKDAQAHRHTHAEVHVHFECCGSPRMICGVFGVTSPGHTIALELLQRSTKQKVLCFERMCAKLKGKQFTCPGPLADNHGASVLRWVTDVLGSHFFRAKEGSWEAGAVIRSGHCEVIIILCDGVMFSRPRHVRRNCARRASLVFHISRFMVSALGF